MTTPPPAGWYDDPSMVNTRRYWDGTRWTDHRQEKPSGPAPTQVVEERSSRRAFWRWVGGIVLAIILAAVALRVLYGGGILGGGTSVDATQLEIDITNSLDDKGVSVSDLTCSGAEDVHQGDVTICEGTDDSGKPISVQVTFNSDGSYVWREQ